MIFRLAKENGNSGRRGDEGSKIEHEAKVLEIDKKAVEARLTASGAEQVFSGEVVNIRLDTKDHALKTRGFFARIRKTTTFEEGKEAVRFTWTIKQDQKADNGGRDKNKKKREWDSPTSFQDHGGALSDLIAAVARITGISEPLEEKRRVVKRRTTYRYSEGPVAGATIDIDEITDLSVGGKKREGFIPAFLEIESAHDISEAAAEQQIEECARILGLSFVDGQRNMSEADLLKHYKIL